jgi:hypothetical protein
MPFTVNGIGTTYAGKKNLEKFVGRCEFCGRTMELQNYETMLCACILFIPVLPLARKQVLNYCPGCRRHRVAAAKAWKAIANQSIDTATAALAQRPDDAASAVKLLHTYLGFRQFPEAAELAQAIHRQFSADPGAQVAAAQAFIMLNRLTDADTCYAKALAAAPQHEAARVGLAMRRIDSRNATDAQRLLNSAPAIPVARNPGAYLALARGYQNESLHREALDTLGSVLAVAPKLANDKGVRKLIQTSEKASGAEQSLLPATPLRKRPWFIAGAIAAVLLILLVGGNLMIAQNRTLHVVNGLPAIVRVKFDGGQELIVPPNSRKEVPLAEGQHQAAYTVGDQPQQKTDFAMTGSFFERFFKSKVALFNPGGGAVLLWEQAEYTVGGGGGNGNGLRHQWFLGRDFEYADAADYEFVPFPHSIEMDANSGPVVKSHVAENATTPSKVLNGELSAPPDAVIHYAESHLSAAPADTELPSDYLQYASEHQLAERARNFLAGGLARRPVAVEWHRAYQSCFNSADDIAKLQGQYDAFLAKEPDNSALLYLRGRVEPDSARSLDYFERATKADPNNAYPVFAKAYAILATGDVSGAKSLAENACRLAPNHRQMRDELRTAKLAAGEFKPLELELRQALLAEPFSYPVELQLLEALAAQHDWQGAENAEHEFIARITGAGGSPASAMASEAFTLLMLYQQGRFNELLAQSQNAQLKPVGVVGRFYANLELGRLDDAEHAISDEDSNKDGVKLLSLSIAWRDKGDQAKAAKFQAAAIEALKPYEEGRRVADLLADGPKADWNKVRAAALDPGAKSLVCVALAQQSPEHRAELATLADKLSFRPTYGQHFVKRVATELLKTPAEK